MQFRHPWILFLLVMIAIGALSVFVLFRPGLGNDRDALSDDDESTAVPAPVAVSLQELGAQPNDATGLGGYNVLIADRGNNRLIEVDSQKHIVWEYHFDLPKPGLGADDAFFTDGGKTVIVNLEEYHLIQMIDYATKKVIWSYGVAGKRGLHPGFLNTPDDAYKLPNGDVIVADIQNCRVIEITPDHRIAHQYGHSRQCISRSGFLDAPNGDTPLPNGHILISTIHDQQVLELDDQWNPVFQMKLPVGYPSDPQLTRAGNILIADYRHPGQIVEVARNGTIVWQYGGDSATPLNKPSLAIELPNGNILANDDFNHRVIVIDKITKKIVWQYGVTGKPGAAPGQLIIPDGLDIIKRAAPMPSAIAPLPIRTIGQVTRHAQNFLGQIVRVQGYLLQQERGYAIFSDEPQGPISQYDLPVTGPGLDHGQINKRYTLEGRFVQGGLDSSNKNPDHVELSIAPQ